MNLGKFNYYCRKIHRISLWFVVLFGLIQMITGLTLKYQALIPIDPNSARLLHFQNATLFAIAFAVQMVTGLVMYLTPWIIKQMQKNMTN